MTDKSVQNRVAKTLSLVPKGAVVSYGQLADLSGLPGRARLMGKVLKEFENEQNWHRVVRSDGKIAFPQGSDKAQEQRSLLMSEGVLVRNQRVHMKTYAWKPELHVLLGQLEY